MDIYYKGNTVIAPHPGRKRRKKTYAIGVGNVFDTEKTATFIDKVCATSRCVWCGTPFGQYLIKCPMCQNCQYCGFVIRHDPMSCQSCGNFLPDELLPKKLVFTCSTTDY